MVVRIIKFALLFDRVEAFLTLWSCTRLEAGRCCLFL